MSESEMEGGQGGQEGGDMGGGQEGGQGGDMGDGQSGDDDMTGGGAPA